MKRGTKRFLAAALSTALLAGTFTSVPAMAEDSSGVRMEYVSTEEADDSAVITIETYYYGISGIVDVTLQFSFDAAVSDVSYELDEAFNTNPTYFRKNERMFFVNWSEVDSVTPKAHHLGTLTIRVPRDTPDFDVSLIGDEITDEDFDCIDIPETAITVYGLDEPAAVTEEPTVCPTDTPVEEPTATPYATYAPVPEDAQDIYADKSQTVSIIKGGQNAYFRFVPEKSGTYQFYSDGTSYDTYGYIYDENMNLLASDDDSGADNHFSIAYPLTKGSTYYLRARMYNSSTTGSFDVNVTESTPTVRLSSAVAKPGDEFSVAVSLENVTSFANLSLEVGYDTDALELISYNNHIGAEVFQTTEVGTEPFVMTWNYAGNQSYNGTIAYLYFKVKDDAEEKDYDITVDYYKGRDGSFTDGEDVNYMADYTPLGLRYIGGKVSVVDYIRGDIDDDNSVDYNDAYRLCRYLIGHSVSVVTKALDTDGNRRINFQDLTNLLQFLAGWDVELH